MGAVYLALFQLAASLITRKIQNDATDAAARQKLVDGVNDGWAKVQEAHLAVQAGKDKDAA